MPMLYLRQGCPENRDSSLGSPRDRASSDKDTNLETGKHSSVVSFLGVGKPEHMMFPGPNGDTDIRVTWKAGLTDAKLQLVYMHLLESALCDPDPLVNPIHAHRRLNHGGLLETTQ